MSPFVKPKIWMAPTLAILIGIGLGRLLWADAKAPATAPFATPLMLEVSGTPHELTLPLAAKNNCILTVIARGAVPDRVWAAREADSMFSVPIAPAGDGRYQCNLTDKNLVLALRRTGTAGQFCFFAAANGKTVASVPVSFDLGDAPTAKFSVTADGVASDTGWGRPQRVSEVRVTLNPSLPGTTPTATADGKHWPLALAPTGEADASAYALAITPEIRRAWLAAGGLTVSLGEGLHQPGEATFHVVPDRIAMQDAGVSVWVGAASSTVIPGANDYLRIAAGSINEKTADLELRRADAPRIDPNLSVGELRAFALNQNQYVWGPTRIEYLGQSQSRVRVTVWGGAVAEKLIIDRLPARTDGDAHFVMRFNGNRYEDSAAGAQLRALMDNAKVMNVRQLLQAIADREKELKTTCVVQVNNGGELPLAAWVVQELASLGWDARAGEGAQASVEPAVVP